MSTLNKVKAKSAGEICARYEPAAEVQAVLGDDTTPAELLDRLIADDELHEATRFLAHALPKREAVWWACLCARSVLPADAKPEVEDILKIAETWVYKPTEENRRAAMASAEAVGFDAPASWAAVAAFWSGGSMAPPEAPPVAPGDELTGTAVSAAVMIAALQTEPERAQEKYRQFLDQGIDVANGGSGRSEGAPA